MTLSNHDKGLCNFKKKTRRFVCATCTARSPSKGLRVQKSSPLPCNAPHTTHHPSCHSIHLPLDYIIRDYTKVWRPRKLSWHEGEKLKQAYLEITFLNLWNFLCSAWRSPVKTFSCHLWALTPIVWTEQCLSFVYWCFCFAISQEFLLCSCVAFLRSVSCCSVFCSKSHWQRFLQDYGAALMPCRTFFLLFLQAKTPTEITY